ncbi:MAG: outer membrane beta-barrel protein [Chitinophagaceae bacterium]|nr:outer membrane beta-barrel protein [Chitinophagaceae bacterium]
MHLIKLDEYTFQKGNINLRPQCTNSIGLTNTYKFKLTTTLNFSHVKDLFHRYLILPKVQRHSSQKKFSNPGYWQA